MLPHEVASDASATCTVTLSKAAPSALSVALSDNSAALTTPASVAVASGSSTATFSVSAASVTSNQSLTISASLNGSSATTAITISAPPSTITKLLCSPTTLPPAIRPTAPSPFTGGPHRRHLHRAFGNSSARLSPLLVAVSSGAITGNFAASAGKVSGIQSAVVTASLNGTATVALLTIEPAPLTSGPVSAYSSMRAVGPPSATLSATKQRPDSKSLLDQRLFWENTLF